MINHSQLGLLNCIRLSLQNSWVIPDQWLITKYKVMFLFSSEILYSTMFDRCNYWVNILDSPFTNIIGGPDNSTVAYNNIIRGSVYRSSVFKVKSVSHAQDIWKLTQPCKKLHLLCLSDLWRFGSLGYLQGNDVDWSSALTQWKASNMLIWKLTAHQQPGPTPKHLSLWSHCRDADICFSKCLMILVCNKNNA